METRGAVRLWPLSRCWWGALLATAAPAVARVGATAVATHATTAVVPAATPAPAPATPASPPATASSTTPATTAARRGGAPDHHPGASCLSDPHTPVTASTTTAPPAPRPPRPPRPLSRRQAQPPRRRPPTSHALRPSAGASSTITSGAESSVRRDRWVVPRRRQILAGTGSSEQWAILARRHRVPHWQACLKADVDVSSSAPPPAPDPAGRPHGRGRARGGSRATPVHGERLRWPRRQQRFGRHSSLRQAPRPAPVEGASAGRRCDGDRDPPAAAGVHERHSRRRPAAAQLCPRVVTGEPAVVSGA